MEFWPVKLHFQPPCAGDSVAALILESKWVIFFIIIFSLCIYVIYCPTNFCPVRLALGFRRFSLLLHS